MRSDLAGSLAALATVLALVGSAPGQEPSPVEQATALLEKARPHLEAVMGCRIERLPPVRLATPADHQKWERDSLAAQLRWQFRDLTDATLPATLAATQDLCARATVARYCEGPDTILLLPDNLARIAAWSEELKEVNSPAFLQLALVHETARWVMDKRYAWNKRRTSCRDNEAWQALQALVEGRAQWVAWEVAQRLGTEATFSLAAHLLLRAPDVATDPSLRSASQQILRQRYWAYVQGLAFYTDLEARGLRDVESRVFTRPPGLMEWINRPELFQRALQKYRTPLETVLAEVEPNLPPASWSSAQQSWTSAMVAQVAELVGERSRAEKLAAGWEEGRMLVFTSKAKSTCQVAVSAARFEDVATARTYFAFAGELQRKQEEQLAKPEAVFHLVGLKTKSVTLPGVDETTWTDKSMQIAGGQPSPVSQLLIRMGAMVVEINWNGVAGDTEWAGKVVEILRAAGDG